MSVKDKATKAMSFLRHGIQHDRKDTISGVHVNISPGSVETLVRRGEITNHILIANSLSDISAKKLPKSVDVCCSYCLQHQCRFLRHSVDSVLMNY